MLYSDFINIQILLRLIMFIKIYISHKCPQATHQYWNHDNKNMNNYVS